MVPLSSLRKLVVRLGLVLWWSIFHWYYIFIPTHLKNSQDFLTICKEFILLTDVDSIFGKLGKCSILFFLCQSYQLFHFVSRVSVIYHIWVPSILDISSSTNTLFHSALWFNLQVALNVPFRSNPSKTNALLHHY